MFVYNWQKLQEILLEKEYFIDNSYMVIVLQTGLYAFLFLSGICLASLARYRYLWGDSERASNNNPLNTH